MVKEYDFTVHLRGVGDTPEQAWEDVCRHVRFKDPDDEDMPLSYRELGELDEGKD